MPDNVEYVQKANDLLYNEVTQSLSDQIVKKYKNDTLTLAELDKWKNDELPSILQLRFTKHKNCWLNKEELVLLMDWKLAKGVFRPILPKLIKSNTPEQVESVTKAGLSLFLDYTKGITKGLLFWNDDSQEKRTDYKKIIRSSFKKLCELKGVGPATASLILSLTTKIEPYLVPPFFSDESFLYFVITPCRPDTKIKYSVKEYVDELLEKYFDILFGYSGEGILNMEVLEKGGWSLKMYDNHRIDSLADLKIPFDIEDIYFSEFHYSEDKHNIIEKGTEERNVDQPKRKKQKK